MTVSIVYFAPKDAKLSEEAVTAAGQLALALQGRFATVNGGPTFALSHTIVATGLKGKAGYRNKWKTIWAELRARNLVTNPVALCVLHSSLGKACMATDEGLVMVSEKTSVYDAFAALDAAGPELDANGPTPPGPPQYIEALDDESVSKDAASPPAPSYP